MDESKAYIVDETPLYNSRIIACYVRLLERRYRDVDVAEVLFEAGIEAHDVDDRGHWFTQDEVNRFHQSVVAATGNPHISREAGRFSASPEALGVVRHYFMGLAGLGTSLEHLNLVARRLTRSTVYESKRLARNSIEICVTQRPGAKESHFQCENRKGWFEAAIQTLAGRDPIIEHPECAFAGGQCCRYIVSWTDNAQMRWRRGGQVVVLGLWLVMLGALAISPSVALVGLLPAAVIATLGGAFIASRADARRLRELLDKSAQISHQLLEQQDLIYSRAMLAADIGQVISQRTGGDEILVETARRLDERHTFDRGLILMCDPAQRELSFRAGFGFTAEQLELCRNTRFPLADQSGPLAEVLLDKRPLHVKALGSLDAQLSPAASEFVHALGGYPFICCPIVVKEKPVGVLAVDNARTGRFLVRSDISFLMGLTRFVGTSLRTAELLRSQVQQFRSIVAALGASIDARDPLTAGHSNKVTEYSLGICDELGLSIDEREVIRVAALLHDYGKIGVPDSILKKPGPLTAEEYEIVKTHCEGSRQILRQVRFEGRFRDVPDIAAAHHEKLDGSGYPLGLAGDQIPLGAKIIAVADVFEALTARRHYREPMPSEEAFKLLQEGRGVHFDPLVLDAFVSFLKQKKTPLRPAATEELLVINR